MPLCRDRALKPPRECIKLWHRCSNSENGDMSLLVSQNCNHFGCSYHQIFIEQSFMCVHFSSFVNQCERLISSCYVPVITCLCCWGRGWALILLFFILHQQWEMCLATVIVLAKLQIATVLISTIDWHKPSRIPQNAELVISLSKSLQTGLFEHHVWSNWYAQTCRF